MKNIRIKICTIIWLLQFANISNAVLVEWQVSSGGNGHLYEVVSVPDGISWIDAKEAAEQRGGFLVTLTSEKEDQFVYNLLDSSMVTAANWSPWLGGFQPAGSAEPDGNWKWVTGEPFNYTNWYVGEPSNSGNEGEDSLVYYYESHQWNDLLGFNAPSTYIYPIGYIVEYIPEPASLLLLALGGMALRYRRS